MPPGVLLYAMFFGIAMNHGIPMIAVNCGTTWVSLILSVRPFATRPEICEDFPAANDVPPTRNLSRPSAMPYAAYIFGLRFRSKDRTKFFAVTGSPLLSFRPLRMWKV